MIAGVHSPHLPAADGEEVMSAARRFFDSGLCCAVEVECAAAPGADDVWEPRMLVFASAEPAKALAAVEDTVALLPGTRVRLVGYEPIRLSPVPLPAALVCSPR